MQILDLLGFILQSSIWTSLDNLKDQTFLSNQYIDSDEEQAL